MTKQYKILHLFRWRIADIINVLPKVQEQGFNAIQISPLQECREGGEWWKLYQNLSYRIGNQLGSAEELHKLCVEAETYGIEIIADVLLHNVASKNGTDIHPYVDPKIAQYVVKDLPECKDYEDRYQTTHLRVGLPTVNYWLPEVQIMHFNMLEEYYNIGVKGFRIDQAKHFATYQEGCNYFTNVYTPFKDKGIMVYGEVLDSEQSVIDMYARAMLVGTNKRTSDPSKQVAFFESHDNYYTFRNTINMKEDEMIYYWNELVNIEKLHSLFLARPIEDRYCNLWLDERIKKINGGN